MGKLAVKRVSSSSKVVKVVWGKEKAVEVSNTYECCIQVFLPSTIIVLLIISYNTNKLTLQDVWFKWNC